jgi:hypothetical protein
MMQHTHLDTLAGHTYAKSNVKRNHCRTMQQQPSLTLCWANISSPLPHTRHPPQCCCYTDSERHDAVILLIQEQQRGHVSLLAQQREVTPGAATGEQHRTITWCGQARQTPPTHPRRCLPCSKYLEHTYRQHNTARFSWMSKGPPLTYAPSLAGIGTPHTPRRKLPTPLPAQGARTQQAHHSHTHPHMLSPPPPDQLIKDLTL